MNTQTGPIIFHSTFCNKLLLMSLLVWQAANKDWQALIQGIWDIIRPVWSLAKKGGSTWVVRGRLWMRAPQARSYAKGVWGHAPLGNFLWRTQPGLLYEHSKSEVWTKKGGVDWPPWPPSPYGPVLGLLDHCSIDRTWCYIQLQYLDIPPTAGAVQSTAAKCFPSDSSAADWKAGLAFLQWPHHGA